MRGCENLGPAHVHTHLQFLAAKALICDLHEVQRLCPSLPRLAHSFLQPYSKRPDVSPMGVCVACTRA